MHKTQSQKYMNFFKELKKRLVLFGATFKYQKKKDEGYIILMDNFFTLLLDKFYQIGDHDQAFEIFKENIEIMKLNLDQLKNDDNWVQFMHWYDLVLGDYNIIMEQKENRNPKDPKTGFTLTEVEKDFEDQKWELQEHLSQISETEPAKQIKEAEKNQTEVKFAEESEIDHLNVKTVLLQKTEQTKLQQFHEQFGKLQMEIDSDYFTHLLTCFDYIQNKRTNDEIMDHLLINLKDNFDAALFLIENRQQINEELKEAKEKVDQEMKQKTVTKTYAKISSNIMVTKKKKVKQEMGVDKQEQLLIQLGLKEKQDQAKQEEEKFIKEFKERKQEQEDDEYAFFETDFFKESQESLKTKYQMRRTDGAIQTVFDVAPKTKNVMYKQTQIVTINEAFPEEIRGAFTDSEQLNNLQSVIYNTVFNTDENVLCCAPTGAGKTNVALMSILRLCRLNYDPKTQKVTQGFKVVYISPLKALATEIVRKFTSKLSFLGVQVREFTGDISLSKKELSQTHIIVSTPEKWDVVTRKSESLNTMINLLIIDEIHLLDDERGVVLESLVARTIRLIENKQYRIRLLGLSATLPNYKDVAKFMRVGKNGLFFFDESFRPVPLMKKFVGIKNIAANTLNKSSEIMKMGEMMQRKMTQKDLMNISAYDICMETLRKKQQLLIFVHSRKETIQLAEFFIFRAQTLGEMNLFLTENSQPHKLSKRLENRELQQLVLKGIGAHNAGIKRKDRLTIEKAFCDKQLSVVFCTATLAWGINMPCHTVIIKGTDFYEPGVGFKPISLLDVQQIFGRAGRPQYDQYGEAVLITSESDLNYFVSMLSYVRPIESKFKPFLKEALLAEVVLGNICNMQEALDFVKSTFYYVRMCKNPLYYGIKNPSNREVMLFNEVREVLMDLNYLRLIRYDEINQIVEPTQLGRITSHYYINCQTMEKLCHYLQIYDDEDKYQRIEDISEENLIGIIAQASEFEQISMKPEEEPELIKLKRQFNYITVDEKYKSLYAVDEAQKGGIDSMQKILLLVWGYLNRQEYEVWSLHADTNYIIQNAQRILRCLLEIALRQNSSIITEKIIIWMRYLENCVNEDQTPLRCFCFENVIRSAKSIRNQQHEINRSQFISNGACNKLEWSANYKETGYLYEDIGNLREDLTLLKDIRLSAGQEKQLTQAILAFPFIDLHYSAKPIARSIMKVKLKLKPMCRYNRCWHQKNEIFWVLVSDGNELIHHSSITLNMSEATLSPIKDGPPSQHNPYQEHSFYVPIRENSPNYICKVMSQDFIDADAYCEIDLQSLALNFEKMEYTNLLDLRPLRKDIVQDQKFEKLFPQFEYFNPIQTQTFFALYHTDENTIVGAPTGSGKTVLAELSILRVFREQPHKKVVYVAPYKALVKERVKDWKKKFTSLNKRVEELSGDYTPDFNTLVKTDILVTTPEKWDGVSRSWNSRSYVKNVALLIFDEIHLLGQERGPVIEVIVSRMNFISNKLNNPIRMIGLSTAMATAEDVGSWFGVKPDFMFNFSPSVRPVPVSIFFKGFSDKNYCPRMNSMNKPAYNDIKRLSGGLPVLVFVSSRRQTRLTALDLISLAANDFQTKSPFLKLTHEELQALIPKISDQNLKHTLSFGIGMHHAGLIPSDRMIVEDLFEASKIQVLVATSTLAWGVNFPAKLVIIKGTEFFDPKINGYKDMPISDILQMIGRAGRPQFNDEGFACVYVEKSKKNFYRKYLNEPFPIESEFLTQIAENFNAEIATGSIKNKRQCVDFLTWTYFFKRILRNPTFYGLKDREQETIKKYLINLVDENLFELKNYNCIEIQEDEFTLQTTFLGSITSQYYLKPKTVFYLDKKLEGNLTIRKLIHILSGCEEYAEVPVRHNEDQMNLALAKICPYQIDKNKADDPKTKTYLLFQAYFGNLPLPIRDYITDTKLVLDSAFRIIAAMIDICTYKNQLKNCIYLVQLIQMIVQGTWITSSCFYNIPNLNKNRVNQLKAQGIEYLSQLIEYSRTDQLRQILSSLQDQLNQKEIDSVLNSVKELPDISLQAKIFENDKEGKIIQKTPLFSGGENATLVITLERQDAFKCAKTNIKKLKKRKNFCWFLIAGNMKDNRIYGIRKFVFDKKITKDLQIKLPKNLKRMTEIDILLLSDSFIGLDQIHTLNLSDYIDNSEYVIKKDQLILYK